MAINVSDIAIRIGAIYNGQTAFKQAEKATRKLEANVKSLGRSFGVAFGGASLAYAVKSSVQAFATAEKELSSLRNTVKNLGLEFAQTDIEDYIKKIGRLYGVTGSQAVPAMQSLLTATGSVSASMDIFNTALDLAYSRNKDVSEVAQDLANAYVGNTKALNGYSLGLTKAEIASMSFSELMAEIGSQTKGAATEGTKTFANQLAILTETSNQAKEVIGKSLVEALASLSGKEGADGAATTITKLANGISKTVEGITYLVKKISWAKPTIVAAGIAIMAAWAPWFTAISAAVLAIGWLGNKLKGTQLDTSKIGTGKSYFAVQAERLKAEKAKAAAELAAKKRAAELLATQKKITAEKKAQAAVDKANALIAKANEKFDLEGIQLQAALQKSQDAGDRTRLELKKAIWDLDQAIAQNDQARIASATALLEKLLGQFNILSQSKQITDALAKLFDFIGLDRKLIDLMNLAEALKLLTEMSKIQFATVSGGKALQGTSLNGFTPQQIVDYAANVGAVNPDMPIFSAGLSGFYGQSETISQQAGDIYVNAYIEGNVTTQDDLVQAIKDQLLNAQQSGQSITWQRSALPASIS